jgi:hypothetical protein
MGDAFFDGCSWKGPQSARTYIPRHSGSVGITRSVMRCHDATVWHCTALLLPWSWLALHPLLIANDPDITTTTAFRFNTQPPLPHAVDIYPYISIVDGKMLISLPSPALPSLQLTPSLPHTSSTHTHTHTTARSDQG